MADQIEDFDHLRALGQDIPEGPAIAQLLAEQQDFVPQFPLLEGEFDEEGDVLRVRRFYEKVIGPEAHRLHGFGNPAVAGRDDHRDGDFKFDDQFDQLQAVKFGHPQVRNQNGIRPFLEPGQSRGPIGYRIDGQTQRHLQ